MAEDMRELLHDAAPRPVQEPDFLQMWTRARNQRRMIRLAAVAGAVVLLAIGGVGLTQLATSGPGDVYVADEPGTYQQLRGRGQDFGEAETADGVPYVGSLRVSDIPTTGDREVAPDQNQVCVSVRVGPQGERSGREHCGLLEQYLRTDRVLRTYSEGQEPDRAAIAAWTPLEVEHAIWELSGEELPIDVLEAPGLPGSVFVIAIDNPPAEDTTIVLYDTEGSQLDRFTLDGSS